MSGGRRDGRSPLIAAAIILIVAGVVLSLLPRLVLWLGFYSPWLATAAGICVILAFFLVFWLRARYQRRHPEDRHPGGTHPEG